MIQKSMFDYKKEVKYRSYEEIRFFVYSKEFSWRNDVEIRFLRTKGNVEEREMTDQSSVSIKRKNSGLEMESIFDYNVKSSST